MKMELIAELPEEPKPEINEEPHLAPDPAQLVKVELEVGKPESKEESESESAPTKKLSRVKERSKLASVKVTKAPKRSPTKCTSTSTAVPVKKPKEAVEQSLSTLETVDEKSSPLDGNAMEAEGQRTPKKAKKKRDRSAPKIREIRAPLVELMMRMNLLICDVCGVEKSTFLELNKHFLAAHKRRAYLACCNRRFCSIEAYDHMKYHMDMDTFKCDQCDHKSKSARSLIQHKNAFHLAPGGYKYYCETCGKGYLVLSLYKRHLLKHVPIEQTNFKCELCGKGFHDDFKLKRHVIAFHERPTSHICEVCGKGYVTRVGLNTHVLSHKETKTQKCDVCGKNYFYLARHKQLVHGSSQALIKCNQCGLEVKELYFKRHVERLHTNVVLHKCNTCGKEFKLRHSLRVHMDIHLGIKYDCYFCPNQATSIQNRIKHMKEKHLAEYLEFQEKRFTAVRVKNTGKSQ